MSETPAKLPGFWRLAWLFFMRPITLNALLRGLQMELHPNTTVSKTNNLM